VRGADVIDQDVDPALLGRGGDQLGAGAGGCEVVPDVGRAAARGARRIDLTTREYELLELFMRHPRQVLLRDQILDRIWGDATVESNAIEVHIGRLRDKLEADGEQRLIQTIRGAGYVLREESP
jgi:two-component system response regulator MprA